MFRSGSRDFTFSCSTYLTQLLYIPDFDMVKIQDTNIMLGLSLVNFTSGIVYICIAGVFSFAAKVTNFIDKIYF